MGGPGARFGIDLARARACHRSHSPIARALCGNGMADRRRQYLRQCTSHRGVGSSSAFARGDRSDIKEQAGGQSDRAGARTYARDIKYLRVDRRNSIELRLDAFRRLAVVGFATEFTLAQFRNNGAGRRQALAVDLGRLLPKLRAYDRLGAVEINALDVNDEHTARQLAVDGEALHQFGIDGDRRPAVHAQRFLHAWHQAPNYKARITDDVAKPVDAIVARTIGDRQRLVVKNPHKPGRVTFGRAIKSLGTCRRDSHKRRHLNQLAIAIADIVDLFDDRSSQSLSIKRLELVHRRDQMIVVGHRKSPSSRARSCRPSCALIARSRITPGCTGAASRTGMNCSVRPSACDSTRTRRCAPTSRSRYAMILVSPFSRNRRARSLTTARSICGMRAAGVPGRGENGKT